MGLFLKRSSGAGPSAPSLGELLLQGYDLIGRTSGAHQQRWGLGGADRAEFDQAPGRMRWSFADHRVCEAPAQVLGTYDPSGGIWIWAWANQSFSPNLCRAAQGVRAWGQRNQESMLTTSRFVVSNEEANDLATIGFRLSRATGFDRADTDLSYVFLTFGSVTITHADRHVETFTLAVE